MNFSRKVGTLKSRLMYSFLLPVGRSGKRMSSMMGRFSGYMGPSISTQSSHMPILVGLLFSLACLSRTLVALLYAGLEMFCVRRVLTL